MAQLPFNLTTQAAGSLTAMGSIFANIVNQYIVTANNIPFGVNGYVFDVVDDEEMHLESDITDSYIETNSAVQDNIVLRPLKFSLKGYVGELTYTVQNNLNEAASIISELLPVASLLPSWNTQDSQVYSGMINTNNQAISEATQIQNIATVVNQLISTTTKQQQAYNIFYNFWLTRTLCTIQTPFGLLTNMAIESVRPLQSGKTRIISEFVVTFKQLQFVGTAVTLTASNPNPAGSATQQSPLDAVKPANITNDSQQNSPLQIQNGTTSGRLNDMLSNSPVMPGPNNAGSSFVAGTDEPVTVENSILKPQLISTLPLVPQTPMVQGIVPII